MNRHCPTCDSTNTKKNGHIHNGKQNHCCKQCGRQFVSNPQQILISSAKREQIRKLLLERIPLRGICRVEGVSLRWLLGFMVDLYDQLPDDLNLQAKAEAEELMIYTLESEVDEMLSFVSEKANKQWIWIAMDRGSRQIIAFHVGDRSRVSAQDQKEVNTPALPQACYVLYRWMAGLCGCDSSKATSSRQKAEADN